MIQATELGGYALRVTPLDPSRKRKIGSTPDGNRHALISSPKAC